MKRSLLISLLVLLALQLAGVTAWAQREGENWHFGRHVSLSFATGEPTTVPGSQIDTREGCASMSDSAGNLLFYSDGSTVWSSDNSVMTNGTRLMGDESSTQSCIVVPWPNTPGMYYLFTTHSYENGYINGLRYNTINMNANSGKGAVEQRNVLLHAPAAEKITAVRHRNGIDVWLISHEMGSSSFVLYLITEAGIDTQSITRDVGPELFQGDVGYLKSNLQGNRLAMACSVPSALTLFTFDNSTGMISEPTELTTSPMYGIEFSPNGRYLYASSHGQLPIYQYDLSLPRPEIRQNAVIVGPERSRGALQLAPNGRIYGVSEGEFNNSLEVIGAPDTVGTDCRYLSEAVKLNGRGALGLPNFFPAVLTVPPTFEIKAEKSCTDDTVTASLTPEGQARNIRWDVGELGYLPAPSDTFAQINHVYRTAGKYRIAARFIKPSGKQDSTFVEVDVVDRPQIMLSHDTTICAGSAAILAMQSKDVTRWLPHPDIADPTSDTVVVRPTVTTTYIAIATNDVCERVDSVTVFVEGEISLSANDLIVKVQPGERIAIPIPDIQQADQVLNLVVQIRCSEDAAQIGVISSPGVTLIDSVVIGEEIVLTVSIASIHRASSIFTLDVLPLLTSYDATITVAATGRSCLVADTLLVVLVSEHCAGPIRNVTIGSSAPTTIAMMPNPIGTSGTIVWQSPAIGEHEISIYSAGGSLIRTFTVERTVDSPTTGEIILDRSGLAAGLYRIVMQVRMSSTVQSCPLYVY